MSPSASAGLTWEGGSANSDGLERDGGAGWDSFGSAAWTSLPDRADRSATEMEPASASSRGLGAASGSVGNISATQSGMSGSAGSTESSHAHPCVGLAPSDLSSPIAASVHLVVASLTVGPPLAAPPAGHGAVVHAVRLAAPQR